jgi:hypothetical protein
MPIIGTYSGGSASANRYSTVDELLTQLPDNTSNLIVAQDVRDSVYTLWETINENIVQGMTGTQGPQGDLGDLGPQGNQGPQGPRGNQGFQGTQGGQGPQGTQGNRGFQGFQGPQGNKGTGVQGPQGPQGSDGGGGGVTFLVGKSIFVSADYGSDITGTAYRFDLMFRTLTAAQSVAVDGDTIIVYPGTYDDGNLGADGVNWYFYIGAIVSPKSFMVFKDGGFKQRYIVDGMGEFYSTAMIINLTNIDSYVTFNCLSMTSITYDTTGCIDVSDATLKLYHSGDITTTIAKSLPLVSVRGQGSVTIDGIGSISSMSKCLYITGSSSLYISSKGGVNLTQDDNTDCLIEVNGGDTIIDTTVDISTVTSSNSPINISGTFSSLTFNNDISSRSQTSLINCIVDGNINFNCNISSQSQLLFDKSNVTFTDGILKTNGSAKGSLAISGKALVRINDYTVYNLYNSITAYVIELSSSNSLILDDAKILSTQASFNIISLSGTQSISVYSAYSNAANSGINNVITGTSIIVDVDVK